MWRRPRRPLEHSPLAPSRSLRGSVSDTFSTPHVRTPAWWWSGLGDLSYDFFPSSVFGLTSFFARHNILFECDHSGNLSTFFMTRYYIPGYIPRVWLNLKKVLQAGMSFFTAPSPLLDNTHRFLGSWLPGSKLLNIFYCHDPVYYCWSNFFFCRLCGAAAGCPIPIGEGLRSPMLQCKSPHAEQSGAQRRVWSRFYILKKVPLPLPFCPSR